MSKPTAKGIEAIAVKRAALADADKVRYRVYRDEVDFVAVIAESALMAMKVSGINTPHRIVRDLPSEGVAIEAKRMAKVENAAEKVMLAVEQKRAEHITLKAELPEANPDAAAAGFVPMQVKDFQKKKTSWARILSPDEVEQAQAAAKPAPQPAPPPVAAPVVEEIEPIAAAPAMEAMPAAEPAPVEPPPPPADTGVLSEEEVQKLLNS